MLIAKTRELIKKNQFVLYLIIFLVALFVYLWIQSSPSFLDPDSFYHLKMAKLIYENRGPILNFPWLQFTVLKDYYIDQHFLYHVFAIPFIYVLGDFLGFKFYTVILSTAFILLSYALFKKYKLIYPGLFVILLIFSPALLFRISLAKASAFSLIILFIGIHCIFRKKYWLLCALSFFYVWSYGGFLLILGMAGLFAIADSLDFILKNKIAGFWRKILSLAKKLFSLDNIKLILATALGIILGVIVNPYFPKNVYFYWQQIVQIGIINYRGAVNVGGEWYPYDIANLLPDSGAIIIFAALAIILFVILYKKQKKESIFFFLATIIFLGLTLKSKRYVEYFIPFLVYFSAFALTFGLEGTNIFNYLKQVKKENARLGKILTVTIVYLVIIIPFILAKDLYQTHESYTGGIKFSRFAGISQYLLKNSMPGEIVMHTSWDDFPMLFYYNDKNYYIVGLDPTFMYNYNSQLYNLYADITMAKISTNLYSQIKNNFKASYFIVNSGRDQLERNLILDGNFSKVYSDSDGEIFKLK